MSDSNRDTNYSRPPMNTNLRDPNLGLCEPTALLIPAPIGQQAIYAARVQNATALTAQRNPVPLRMDLLVPEFLEDMARIMAVGAGKYGELNWQNGGLTGNKSGLNHALMNLMEYMRGTPNACLNRGTRRRRKRFPNEDWHSHSILDESL